MMARPYLQLSHGRELYSSQTTHWRSKGDGNTGCLSSRQHSCSAKCSAMWPSILLLLVLESQLCKALFTQVEFFNLVTHHKVVVRPCNSGFFTNAKVWKSIHLPLLVQEYRSPTHMLSAVDGGERAVMYDRINGEIPQHLGNSKSSCFRAW